MTSQQVNIRPWRHYQWRHKVPLFAETMPLRRPGTSAEINYKLKTLFLLPLSLSTRIQDAESLWFLYGRQKRVEAINVIRQLKAIACEHSWMAIINCCVTRMPLTTERFPVWLSKVGEMKGMLPQSTHRTNSFKGNTKPINIHFHKTYNKAIGFLIRIELITISFQREKDMLEMKK